MLHAFVVGSQLGNNGRTISVTGFDLGGIDLLQRFNDSRLLHKSNRLLVDDGLVLGLDLLQIRLRCRIRGLLCGLHLAIMFLDG